MMHLSVRGRRTAEKTQRPPHFTAGTSRRGSGAVYEGAAHAHALPHTRPSLGTEQRGPGCCCCVPFEGRSASSVRRYPPLSPRAPFRADSPALVRRRSAISRCIRRGLRIFGTDSFRADLNCSNGSSECGSLPAHWWPFCFDIPGRNNVAAKVARERDCVCGGPWWQRRATLRKRRRWRRAGEPAAANTSKTKTGFACRLRVFCLFVKWDSGRRWRQYDRLSRHVSS